MAAKKAAANTTPEAKGPTLEFEGQQIEFDLDELTFGEVEIIEDYFGKPLEEVELESLRGVMILAYLELRKTNPDITLDDMREKKVSLLKINGGPEDDASPSTETVS